MSVDIPVLSFIAVMLAIAWVTSVAMLCLTFMRSLAACWREPVLKHPVLVIESDDWGPGPSHHAQALESVRKVLEQHCDASGQPAVMTLGLTLSVPDFEVMAKGTGEYQALYLDHQRFAPILDAIQAGSRAKVFALQLHGAAHYWPPALVQAAQFDSKVKTWLTTEAALETEKLPTYLQARWVDASSLPSRPLDPGLIWAAAKEEVNLFERIFGIKPEVAVPPTFVWNELVEDAWAMSGVRCVITPGQRYHHRDHAGAPSGHGVSIFNGQQGKNGLIYLVRDRYFEPSKGHKAETALADLKQKAIEGRPLLLETHRFNFTDEGAQAAIAELDRLLGLVLLATPRLRFIASADLAREYQTQGGLVEPGFFIRLSTWITRLHALPRFWKLARLSGLAAVLTAIGWLLPATPITGGE
ncbi:MAG: hypothetical protein Q8L39_08200, partial [Burkholderiales bacterium]|nr:hypothetical protein [Burkholderiales bacterium]